MITLWTLLLATVWPLLLTFNIRVDNSVYIVDNSVNTHCWYFVAALAFGVTLLFVHFLLGVVSVCLIGSGKSFVQYRSTSV